MLLKRIFYGGVFIVSWPELHSAHVSHIHHMIRRQRLTQTCDLRDSLFRKSLPSEKSLETWRRPTLHYIGSRKICLRHLTWCQCHRASETYMNWFDQISHQVAVKGYASRVPSPFCCWIRLKGPSLDHKTGGGCFLLNGLAAFTHATLADSCTIIYTIT